MTPAAPIRKNRYPGLLIPNSRKTAPAATILPSAKHVNAPILDRASRYTATVVAARIIQKTPLLAVFSLRNG